MKWAAKPATSGPLHLGLMNTPSRLNRSAETAPQISLMMEWKLL
jgi:hypothetical protein